MLLDMLRLCHHMLSDLLIGQLHLVTIGDADRSAIGRSRALSRKCQHYSTEENSHSTHALLSHLSSSDGSPALILLLRDLQLLRPSHLLRRGQSGGKTSRWRTTIRHLHTHRSVDRQSSVWSAGSVFAVGRCSHRSFRCRDRYTSCHCRCRWTGSMRGMILALTSSQHLPLCQTLRVFVHIPPLIVPSMM